MAKCSEVTREELYRRIVESYGGLKGNAVNDLVTAIKDIVDTKFPLTKARKFVAINDFLKGKTFSELFTQRSTTFNNFAFSSEINFADSVSVRKELIAHGVNERFASYLSKHFEAYRGRYLSNVATNAKNPSVKKTGQEEKAWHVSPLSVLYGEPNEDGNYVLPDAVLFNMMMATFRHAYTIPDKLTNKEMGMLVHGDPDAGVTTKTAENLENGGVNSNTFIYQVGSTIFNSMNIQSIIEQDENSALDYNTVDGAGALAERIKYAIGLLAVDPIGSKIRFDGQAMLSKDSVEVEYQQENNETGKVETITKTISVITTPTKRLDAAEGDVELSNFGVFADTMIKFDEDVNLILGDSESSYEPSNYPIKFIKKTVRNSIFKIARSVETTIGHLQNQAWTKGDGFVLVEDLDKDTLRALHGYKDPEDVQIDKMLDQKAKNVAIDREIDNLLNYNRMSRLEKFYVPYKAMNTNRYVQLGPISPQNSKLHRNVIVPYDSLATLVSSKDPEILTLFKLAVSQAFDQDIDKTDLAGGLVLFDRLVSDATTKGTTLNKLVAAYNAKDKTVLNSLVVEVSEQYGADTGVLKGLPALASYLSNVDAKGNVAEFSSTITIESDGVTNGFAISILQFAGGLYENGKLTEEGIEKLNQVGVTLANDDSSMGSRFNSGFRDAYTQFGYSMKSILDDPGTFAGMIVRTGQYGPYVAPELKHIINAKNPGKDVKNVLNAIKVLGFDTTQDSIIRKMAKTPFMVFNYGAGVASIARELAEDVSELYRDKIVKIQQNYLKEDATAADKVKSLKEAQEIFNALNVLGFNKNFSPAKFKELLENNKLHKQPLDQGYDLKNVIALIYKPIVGHAAEEVLGGVSTFRAGFIQAAEMQFMMFDDQFRQEVNKLVKTGKTLEDKLAQLDEAQIHKLIHGTLLEFYPQFKRPNPSGKGGDTFTKDAIDLIKVKYVHPKSNVVKVASKGSKTPTVHARTLQFQEPGAAAVIRPVQNIDSLLLTLAIKAAGGTVSPIHDAVDTPLHLAKSTVNAYNQQYINISENANILNQIWKRIDKSWNSLNGDPAAQDRIRKTFLNTAFVNTHGLPVEARWDDVFNQVETLVKTNNAARKDLFKLLKQEGVKIEQMYLSALESQAPLQDTLETSSNILGSSPESVVNSVKDIFENAKLSTNASKILDLLSKRADPYLNDASRTEETANLRRVLNQIITPIMDTLGEVTVSAGYVNAATRGGYDLDNKEILLNINQGTVETFTEQSSQEVFIHESLHPILHTLLSAGDPLVSKLQEMQNYARKHITAEDFLNHDEQGNIIYRTDPVLERQSAQRQYDYFVGRTHTNAKGEQVASTLEHFIIGALTNKHVINKLKTMPQPAKAEFWHGEGFIQKIVNLVEAVIDRFNRTFREGAIADSAYEQVFSLTQQLVGAQERQKPNIAHQFAIKAKDKLYGGMKDGINMGLDFLGKNGEGKTFIPNAAYVLRNLPEALQVAETQQAFTKAFSAMSARDKSNTVMSLIKEATVGTTNVAVEKMLLLTKHLVEGNRKHTEQTTMAAVQKAFLTPFEDITDLEHQSLTKTVLRLDLSSLMYQGNLSSAEIVELLHNKGKLQRLIDAYANKLGIPGNSLYSQHTKGLAELISMRRTHTRNISLNASTIHTLHLERINSKEVNKAEVAMLDTYVTLLGIQLTPDATLESALRVINREQAAGKEAGKENGFEFLLRHHKNFKEDSRTKLFGGNPIQQRKGYLTHIQDPHVNMIAATDAEAVNLKKQGYTLVGNLAEFDGIDNTGLKLYATKHHVEPAKVAGVLSFTQPKASGTQLFDILARREEYQSVNEYGEIVPNAAKINVAIRNFAHQQNTLAKHEEKMGVSKRYQLIPLRNENTEIVDYRVEMPYRSMEDVYKEGLDMNIDRVLGRMAMHSVDKINSKKVNEDAVKYLVDDAEMRKQDPNAFVDLFSPYYKKHFYDLLPKDLKKAIKDNSLTVKRNGKEVLSFQIRKDNILTFFGHKRLSMASIKLLEHVPRIKFVIKQLEEIWQDIVGLATKNIIMKEIGGVPGPNMISNFFTSMMSGMSPNEIRKYWGAGWKNIEIYKSKARELGQLQVELKGRTTVTKQERARYVQLQQQLIENPIHKMMQMGLFTSISEDIELREFDYLTKVSNKLQKVTKRSPKLVSNIARETFWTEKSTVFRELHHFTQTMDFVARYGMYQHLMNKKGLSENDALAQVFDAFVLYDRPLDPKLDYINKMGLGIFIKFWLFIQRYLYKQAKREPANVAMMLAAQQVSGVDVPDVYDSAILFGNLLPPIGGFEKIMESTLYVPLLDQLDDILGIDLEPDINPF